MPIAKPVGFDNWRTHFFVSKDGSGNKFSVKASFAFLDASMHRLFRGPDIASTNENATCQITTAEAHGFFVGQSVRLSGLPFELAGLNELFVILTVPTTTTFTVGFDSTGLGTSAGVGMVGVDTGTRLPSDDFAIVVGRKCIEDYPDPWELPFEG